MSLAALALPASALLIVPWGIQDAHAEGTRTLHPATGPGSTGNRGVMDLTATLFGGVARQTQFTYVYAREGEVILLGSRNRTTNTGTNRGQIRLWAPQSFGTPGNETDPSVNTAVLDCNGEPGAGEFGLIADRNAELAGPNSADGTATVPNGFTPCWYQVPAGGTGIYGVRFYGAGAGSTNTASIPTPSAHTSTVQAWDVTVRADMSSLVDLNGRVFTYAWSVYLAANSRVLNNELYYVSSDGYRYRQTMRGVDPNRAVFYANPKGFIDAGAPLYKDVRGSNQNVNAGTSFDAGVSAERPTYPIFFSDVDPSGPNAAEVNRVLTALAIPQVPAQPLLTAPTFVGNMSGHTSTVSAGGVFTFTTVNTLTYEIVVRRGAVAPGVDSNHPAGCVDDFDPANVCNRVLTGVALTGSHSVLWNGKDNDGFPFPVGNYDFQIVGRNGEIHFPMIDLEGNVNGGPTLEKLNAYNTAEATTVYFDDRGHTTANETEIGKHNGHLCGATSAQVQPSPNHSLTGVDSADANWNGTGKYYRHWTGNNDPNTDCDSRANVYFGTAKGLDVWALERSPLFVEPVEIVEPVIGVDVGTMATMTPAVLPGDTSFGNFSFSNAGDVDATGVTYSASLGNPLIPASCPAAVNFTVVPTGVTATYNDASHPTTPCTITFAGMPTTLPVGASLNFSFNYIVALSNPGPIPLDTHIDAVNETNPPNIAPNDAHAETVVARPVITVNKAASPGDGTLVEVGDTITYTVTVGIASAPLTALFSFDDTLGAGLSFVGIVNQSPQFSCSGSLHCELPSGTGIGSYTVEYTATVNSSAGSAVANSVTASGGGGENPPSCGTCSTSHPLPAPGLDLDKYATSSGPYAEGDSIEYHFLVANIGNVPLTNVHVNDPLVGGAVSCVPSTLNPGESVVCGPASYTVSAADVTAGYVSNHATATGTAPDASEPTAEDNETVPTEAAPAIELLKSVTSIGPYGAGDTISYRFVATNTGNVELSNVTITDPLPGLSALVCVPPAPATLNVGESMECTASYTVTPADVAAGQVQNTAVAAGEDPDGNPVEDPDTVTTPLAATPGIGLLKRVTSAGPYEAGDVITYFFEVSNTGNVPLTNVHVIDPLLGGTIACAPSALNPSEIATCGPVNYTVTPTDATNGSVDNTAAAHGTDPGSNDVNDDDSTTTPIGLNPALSLEKSVISTGPYGLGDTITYRFRVTNTGNVQLSNVQVTDDYLPGGPFACVPSTLNPTESAYCGPVNYTVTATDVAATQVENTATATGEDPGGNEATDDDTVITPIAAPGVSFEKSSNPASGDDVSAGDLITYTLTATVTDMPLISALVLTDTLSGDQTFGSVTVPGAFAADTSAAPVLSFTLPAGAAPGSYSVSYTATVNADASGSVGNHVTGAGGGPNPPVCGASCDTSHPLTDPAVTYGKSANPASGTAVPAGTTIDYTLTVNVANSATLSDVVLTDTLGTGLTVVTPLPAGCTAAGQVVTCTLAAGAIPAGSPYTFTYQATVDADATVSVGNSVTASGGGDPGDPGAPDPGCATAGGCETSHPITDASIVVSKSANPVDGTDVTAGQTITYTLTTVVSDSATLSDVVLTDTLGAGLSFGSVTSAGAYGVDTSGAPVLVFTLPAGTTPGTYAVSYTATVDAAATVSVGNSVTAVGGGDPGDPSAPNPDCTPCGTSHPLADPVVTYGKSANPASGTVVAAGATISYTLSVDVTNSPTLSDVVLTDTLGTGLTVVTPLPAGCTAAGQVVTCTLTAGATPAGSPYTFVYQATVDADATVSVDNSVAATGGGDPADPTAPDPGCVTPGGCETSHPITDASIVVSKSANPVDGTDVTGGQTITYTLTTVVSDSATLSDVVLTDTLGTGLTYGAVTSAGAYTVNDSGAPVLVFTLAAGTTPGTYAVSYTATVDADATISVGNNVVAVGGGDPADPTAPDPDCTPCETVHPVEPADLSIHKTGPAQAIVGTQIVFTLLIENNGTMPAHDVQVTDPPPAGLTWVANNGDCATPFPCDLGTLLPGESRVIDVTMEIPSDYTGPQHIINTATVTSTSTSESSSSATVPLGGMVPAWVPVNAPWALWLLGLATLLLAGGGLRRMD